MSRLVYESDRAVVAVLGGHRVGGVAFTSDQWRRLMRFYGYKNNSENKLQVAGSYRDLGRDIADDGLRVMGALARHLMAGDDPVAVVTSLMVEAGWDVGYETEVEP